MQRTSSSTGVQPAAASGQTGPGRIRRAYITYCDFETKELRLWAQFDVRTGRDIDLQLAGIGKAAESYRSLDRTKLIIGSKVLATFDDGGGSKQKLYRAVITKCYDDGKIEIHYLDYGNYAIVEMNSIFGGYGDIFKPPPQAIQCVVEGAHAIGGQWTAQAVNYMQQLLCYEEVDVEMKGTRSDCCVIDVYVDTNRAKLSDLLIKFGWATPSYTYQQSIAALPHMNTGSGGHSSRGGVGNRGGSCSGGSNNDRGGGSLKPEYHALRKKYPKLCTDFYNQRCVRFAECRAFHPVELPPMPSGAENWCKDHLNYRCTRDHCDYRHVGDCGILFRAKWNVHREADSAVDTVMALAAAVDKEVDTSYTVEQERARELESLAREVQNVRNGLDELLKRLKKGRK